MNRMEFYYDLVSPYAYLAYAEAGRVAERSGAEIVLRPVLLGALHKAAGIKAPIETPAKGRYQARDIQRWAERYGLPMRFPEPFPFRTLKTMRAVMWCAKRGSLEPFTREAFALFWEEGGAPKGLEATEEDEPLREVARRVELDPDELLAGAAADEAKQALKEATSEAAERGVFATPTFFVGDEMFWGNDRLDFVGEALKV